MDALEYAEKIAGESLDQARDAYDLQYERVYKFATLVASGAGAAGVYAVGRIGTPAAYTLVWPLAALSCWWFVVVGALLLRGAASNKLMIGTGSAAIRARLAKHSAALQASGYSEGMAEGGLWLTRWDQLAAVDAQIEQYGAAATQRARALDRAYWALVCSPAIAGLAYAIAARL